MFLLKIFMEIQILTLFFTFKLWLLEKYIFCLDLVYFTHTSNFSIYLLEIVEMLNH